MSTAIVDFWALERFLETATSDQAHRCAVALQAAASAAQLAAVELETTVEDRVGGGGGSISSSRRPHRKGMA